MAHITDKIKSFLEYINISSFLLKICVLFMSIIIVFNTVCKPQKAEAAVAVTPEIIIAIIVAVTGIVDLTYDIGTDLYDRYKASTDEDLSDSMEDYFKSNISIDGDGNYVLTDGAIAVINGMKEEYDSDVTYVNSYPIDAQSLVGSSFQNATMLSTMQQLMQSYPDLSFILTDSGLMKTFTDEDTSLTLYGYKLIVIEDIQYAVSDDIVNGIVYTSQFYNSNWEGCGYKNMYLCSSSTDAYYVFYEDASGNWDYKDVSDFNYEDIPSIVSRYGYTGKAKTYPNANRSSTIVQTNWVTGDLLMNRSGAIPVFNSVTSMKNGGANGVLGQYIPAATVTNNTITQTEIDNSVNYINNYYPTETTPDDDDDDGSDSDSDGSGSGTGWLSSLLNSIGTLGDAILAILSKVIEILTKIVKLFTDTITDAIDIIPTGIVDFISACFPYIPEEWITVVTLGLTLVVVAIAIKIFM